MHCQCRAGAPLYRAAVSAKRSRSLSILCSYLVAAVFSASLLLPSQAFADVSADSSDAGESDIARKVIGSLMSEASDAGSAMVGKAQDALLARTCVLDYDPALIAQIGSQESSGHWVCCPGFSCSYGDAIIYGTANSHAAYGCGTCTWPGWGGGNSSFRSLGSDQSLLREAYDSIRSGKPTVIHVAGAWNEHWICLIGYTDVTDPAKLSLANFIALDPVDGAQINAASRYTLYGDACEHVSDAL